MSHPPEPIVADFNRMLSMELPAFLVEAYRIILGRPIDPDGFRNYYERSLAGMTRLEILAELYSSAEGQSRSAPLADFLGLLAQAPGPLTGSVSEERAAVLIAGLKQGEAAASLRELLATRDAVFVRCAFQTLLQRQPRPMEFARGLQLLRDGASQMRIICGIAFTKGGVLAMLRLPGAALALVWYLLARIWIVGAVFRALTGAEAESGLDRRVRRTESLLLRMSEERRQEWQDLLHAEPGTASRGK